LHPDSALSLKALEVNTSDLSQMSVVLAFAGSNEFFVFPDPEFSVKESEFRPYCDIQHGEMRVIEGLLENLLNNFIMYSIGEICE
jgi:hypothetical protein